MSKHSHRRRKDAKRKAYAYEWNRAKNLSKYGLTIEAYETMLLGQNGKCAICKKDRSSGQKLAVDHDHETGKVRSLLCVKCNTALGLVDDSPKILNEMLNYLTKHKD